MAEETQSVEKVRRQPSRGMYLLPSLFTAGNMAAGYCYYADDSGLGRGPELF